MSANQLISLAAFSLLIASCAGSESTHAAPSNAPLMISIPGGEFEMGKTVDRGYGAIDGPAHRVRVPPFEMGAREVTVAEFRAFVTETGHVSKGTCNIYTESTSWHIDPERNWERPGIEQGEDHPVLCVSWRDTQAYVEWLNRKTDRVYRLPSEAEWEYVASTANLGGTGGVTHQAANIGKVECCGGKAEGADRWIATAPAGSFPPDRFGLFDVRGNAWEWQADCYHKDYVGAPADGSARAQCPEPGFRAIRGGSYGDAGEFLEPRFRLRGPEQQGYFTVGFRLARSLS